MKIRGHCYVGDLALENLTDPDSDSHSVINFSVDGSNYDVPKEGSKTVELNRRSTYYQYAMELTVLLQQRTITEMCLVLITQLWMIMTQAIVILQL